MPDNSDSNVGAVQAKDGGWRRKRKKRGLISRLTQANSVRKKDYLISLGIVLIFLILFATGASDRLWSSVMSFFESSHPE